MYPLAVTGDNLTARAALMACHKSGFQDITWYRGVILSTPSADAPRTDEPPAALTLPANLSRVINALDGGEALLDLGHLPDRAQVRIGTSGFLLTELPLGQFTTDRYGAPHVNIEQRHLADLLPVAVTPKPQASLADIEQAHSATLVCTDLDTSGLDSSGLDSSDAGHATHQLWHACMPLDTDSHKANITWLGQQQCAWQFATAEHTHVIFSTRLDHPLVAEDWYPAMAEAVRQAQPTHTFDAYAGNVRKHWQAGSVAYLGAAGCKASPYLREASALGLEDAWVISRMLENYEEDVHDGLAEYEKYRRARARRISRAAVLAATQQNRTHPLRRGLHHLNVALSTRFLPEIAMQRIDWLYGYDCIRGFR